MSYLICEICYSAIAQFEQVHQPLSGSMFTSPNPVREIPAPFGAEQAWDDMRCPVCRRRPFEQPDRVMVEHPRCYLSDGKGPSYIDVPAGQVVEQLWPLPPVFEQIRAIEPETDAARAPISSDQPAANTEACTEIEQNDPDAPSCPSCGKAASDFKNTAGFGSHVKFCRAKHGGRP
jgi:hypothetical protein